MPDGSIDYDEFLNYGQFSALVPLNTDFDGERYAIDEVRPLHADQSQDTPSHVIRKELDLREGSVLLFTSKSRMHPSRVTAGPRYTLVAQLGYQQYGSCVLLYREREMDKTTTQEL